MLLRHPSSEDAGLITRVQLTVRGIVQGVGFRPYVFSLAKRRALRGQVRNTTTGVLIDVEGDRRAIEGFIDDLRANSPPLALVDSVERRDHLELIHYGDFRIVESAPARETFVPIAPDIATCQDCLNELFDPIDRRYHYPFINCTNCGPRFTIVQDVPYDRDHTTMRAFPMCVACESEYLDPANRRFHAQPNACPVCGPRIALVDAAGRPLETSESDVIRALCRRLAQGEIVAIKGMGGFHLACDASHAEAVKALRQRKYREFKPFALMASGLAMIRAHCHVSEAEAELLRSPPHPIVLLRKRSDCRLPEVIAPNQNYLGFMLPYTPLHHLLLRGNPTPMVMTSANRSDEPIAYRPEEALERLGSIADCFLMHNRDIYIRCDDAVTQIIRGRAYPVRRSRGYVPYPIMLPFASKTDILACGAELKSTFCLTHQHYAFVSHHIGDLENAETLRSFTEGITHFQTLFHLQPDVVAYDLHPEYLSTKYAQSLDAMASKVGVQHHHAHVASCMVDNRLDGDVIGVAMDGLGYGTDGNLWGSEIMLAGLADFERVCHLAYAPMPGGVKSIQEPWRMAAVYLQQAFGDRFVDLEIPFVQGLNTPVWRVLQQIIRQGINSPLTSGMGRLFDAVSSILGLGNTAYYEGQAAIALEMAADAACQDSYRFELEADGSLIRTEPVLTHIVQDLQANLPVHSIAAKFHHAVADVITRVATRIKSAGGPKRVVLSGGVFQNRLLLEWTWQRLEANGFEVYVHHRVPTNDGGISLGQAVVAQARIKAGRT
jgi:hydrogenase maturation protein HypF